MPPDKSRGDAAPYAAPASEVADTSRGIRSSRLVYVEPLRCAVNVTIVSFALLFPLGLMTFFQQFDPKVMARGESDLLAPLIVLAGGSVFAFVGSFIAAFFFNLAARVTGGVPYRIEGAPGNDGT